MMDRQPENEKDQAVQGDSFGAEEGVSVETWQDDLPPEDDFQDSPESEGAALSDMDEPLPEEDEDGTAEAQPDPGRGKKVLFGILAIAAVFIGGLAYLQFGGASSEAGGLKLGAVFDPSQQARRPAPTEVVAAQDQTVSPKTGETDITSLYKATQSPQANVAMALPNAQEALQPADKAALGRSTDIMTLSDDQAAAAPAPVPAAPAPAAAAPAPAKSAPALPAPTIAKIETIPAAQPAASVPAPVTPAPAPVPVAAKVAAQPATPAPSPELENRVKGMAQQIETLQKSLDQALLQNVELVKRLEAAQAASVALAKEEAAPKKTQAKAPSTHPAIALGEEAAMPLSEPKALAEEKPAPVKKKAAAKPVRAKKTVAEREPAATKKTGWVLRAATPDAIWVAQSAEAPELRRVAVGETLKGIGKIKEIRQKGDSWEVVGSNGVMR